MNHKINLFANVIQYQNIRDVEDEKWVPNENYTSIPIDMENVRIIKKYIRDHKISFDMTDPVDRDIKTILDEILDGYKEFECYSDYDWDLSTIISADNAICSNEVLKNLLINHSGSFVPIFKDEYIKAKVVESFNEAVMLYSSKE
jgi:hypothetical protein